MRSIRVHMSWVRGFVSVAMLMLTAFASAQGYPAKTVRLIVPFPPGGSTEVMARTIATQLTQMWGQQIIIEDRKSTRLNSSHRT